EVARLAPLRPSRADTMMDTARPTRTPRAIATIVSTVVTRVVVPVLSPWSKAATPTRPRAPGTRSQNAGVKLTIAGGPVRCRATRSATGVIAAAPTKADSTPPKNRPPSTWAPYATYRTRRIQPRELGRAHRFITMPTPNTPTASQGPRT